MGTNMEEQTVKELADNVRLLGLEDKLPKGRKPVKQDYITILEEYGNEQRDSASDERLEQIDNPEPVAAPTSKGVENVSPLDWAFSYSKYIIADFDQSVDIKDDEEGRVFRFSWGNSFTGTIQETIPLGNMEPQALRRGAAKHLKSLTMTSFVGNRNNKEKLTPKRLPRFRVVEVEEGFTAEEIEAIQNRLREDKLAHGK
jgi:hypothetical protein